MRFSKKLLVTTLGALTFAGAAFAAAATFHAVAPSKFDPGGTKLVASQWITGIGCPTNAKQSGTGSSVYTDPACTTGDPNDKDNKGLLMAKTGPTANNAAAVAQLKDIPSPTVTELGYDLRKTNSPDDLRGSHCGAGAPRFNVVTSSGTFFVGCNSPPPVVAAVGNGWIRLRWTVAFSDVQAIYIIFDEGQDAAGGPDQFGAAVLDNVDLNGTLVGRG
jgi:hypothetical protein